MAAPHLDLAEPKVLFTEDVHRSRQRVGSTSVRYLQEISRGAQYIDPASDFIRWRTQFDRHGKGMVIKSKFSSQKIFLHPMTERDTLTYYPQHVLPGGECLCFGNYHQGHNPFLPHEGVSAGKPFFFCTRTWPLSIPLLENRYLFRNGWNLIRHIRIDFPRWIDF